MEAGTQPPDENVPATESQPILLSPDTQSDVDMNEPAPAAKPVNPASTPSPAEPPAPRQPEAMSSSASPTQSNGTSAPLGFGGGGRISPAENKERTPQASVPNATTAHASPAIPSAAAVHYPQAARAPQHPNMNTPSVGTPSQLQQRPSLSQQVSTNPMTSLPGVATTLPHVPPARMSPANQAPRVPSHISPPLHPAPTHNGPHRAPSEPSSRTTASPAPSPYIPVREPHTPSAMDPYTVENLFVNGGFHLPDANDSQLSHEAYVEQCNRLHAVIRTTNPSVTRRVMRDTWQSSLAGSESHISFVMNLVTHTCSAASAKIAISKFGKKFVNHAKVEIMSQFTPAMLAEIEDLVVEKAPDSLLDKAMAKRLVTIPARSLLNMLGRAERLGYDESDIIDENTGQPSKPAAPSVQGVPNGYMSGSTGQPAPQAQPQPRPQPSPQPQVVDADPLVCPLCYKRYPSQMTRDHHFKKKICQKRPTTATYLCPLCDQSFSTKAGLDYHRVNKVCGGDGVPGSPAAGVSPNVMASSAGSSPASFTPVKLPSQAQRANAAPSVSTPARPPGQSTPYTAGVPAKVTPIYPPGHPQATPQPQSAPPRSSQKSPHDPYAHLSNEQYNMMEAELYEAEVTYGARMEDARRAIADPALRAKKLDSLKNSFTTKQSMVRKKYGVKLRERRSKAALEQQRMRMQSSQATPKARTPPSSADAQASKRTRGVDGQAVPTQMAVQETPTRKHAASADVAAPLSGGLAASSAAPEMVDPTKFGGAARPPVYSGSGFRAPLYPSSSQGAPAQATPAKGASNSPMKAMLQEAPIEVGDDTESETDSDEDTIPAQLPPPPPRPSQSLSRPAR